MAKSNKSKNASALQPEPPARALLLAQIVTFILLASLLIPAISPAAAVGQGLIIKLLFVARIVALLAAATWFLRLQGRRWNDLGLSRPRWWKTLLAIPLGAVACVVGVGVASAIAARAGAHPANYSMFDPLRGNLGEYLFWATVVTWGTAAFGEELLFRGFLLQSIERLLGGPGRLATVSAILLQAGVFSALHLYQGLGGAAIAGAIGLVLGFVWLQTERNLWAGIIIHGLFDFSSMTAIYLGVMTHR